MTIRKCRACLGAKQVMKTGYMYGDCEACRATGYTKVEDEDELLVPTVLHVEQSEEPKEKVKKNGKTTKQGKLQVKNAGTESSVLPGNGAADMPSSRNKLFPFTANS